MLEPTLLELACAECTGQCTLPGTYSFDIPQPIQTVVANADGILARQITVPVQGSYVPQHAHSYDHLTLLTSGSFRMWRDGEMVGDFTAPAAIQVPAMAKHTFLTLTEGVTFFCIHRTDRTGEVEEAEHHFLPRAAE